MGSVNDLMKDLIAALELFDDCEMVTSPSADDIDSLDDNADAPSASDKITLYLAGSADREVEISVELALGFADALRHGTLVDTTMLVGEHWAIVRLVGQNEKAEHFIQTVNFHNVEQRFFDYNMTGIELHLRGGINPLAISYSKLGIASEIYPEFGNDEIFAFVNSSPTLPPLKPDSLATIVSAYLFEIGRASGISMRIAAFPDEDNEDLPWMDSEARDALQKLAGVQLRPLLVGKGIEDALKLFNEACGLERHPEHLLLGFVRVLEHVSVTVVRQHAYQQIRSRLLSERALDPDASFIEELQRLVEILERKRSDKEAIKETIRTCCDVVELVDDAPPFLSEIIGLSSSSSAQAREQAANILAHALYATRNAVAHAKANYVTSGHECPANELGKFAEVARRAAAQAIRWLGTIDPHYRV